MTAYTAEQIARVCHEAIRAVQVANHEEPSPHWPAAPNSQQNSCLAGVELALAGADPETLFKGWADRRRGLGWKYGPVRDEQRRTHPNLVDDWAELPPEQRVKDRLFCAIVGVLGGTGGAETPQVVWSRLDGGEWAESGEFPRHDQASAAAKRMRHAAAANGVSAIVVVLPEGQRPDQDDAPDIPELNAVAPWTIWYRAGSGPWAVASRTVTDEQHALAKAAALNDAARLKAEYRHECPITGCRINLPASKLMCLADWRKVPAPLQRAVYAAYDHGNGVGSLALLNAQQAAIHAVEAKLAAREAGQS